MDGYKSNNLAPQKRRVQDESVDWTSSAHPESPVLPKKLQDEICKRRRVLQGEGHEHSSGTSSSSSHEAGGDAARHLLVEMGNVQGGSGGRSRRETHRKALLSRGYNHACNMQSCQVCYATDSHTPKKLPEPQ